MRRDKAVEKPTDLQRVREELERSEERYRSFVEHSTEGIWCMEFGEPLSLDLPEEEAVEQIYRRAKLVETNDASPGCTASRAPKR